MRSQCSSEEDDHSIAFLQDSVCHTNVFILYISFTPFFFICRLEGIECQAEQEAAVQHSQLVFAHVQHEWQLHRQ